MKNNLLAVALLSTIVAAPAFSDNQPDQYSYQVALFNGDSLLYKHTSFTYATNQFSDGRNTPYFIKTCEKQGTKTINKSGGKTFYQGVGYRVDMKKATLQVVETVIDESTYTEPKEDELDLCTNTGQPQEREYEYNAKFDLTNTSVQRFTFDNNRVVEITVHKQG